MREYETTHARVFAGQPFPDPVVPKGDGWEMQGEGRSGYDPDGKPCLLWTWSRSVDMQDEPVEEDLVQVMP